MGTSLSKHWGFHHGHHVWWNWDQKLGAVNYPSWFMFPERSLKKVTMCYFVVAQPWNPIPRPLRCWVLLMMRYFFVLYFGLFWYFWFDHASYIHVLAFACVLQWLRVDSDLYVMIVLEKSNCCHNVMGLPHGSSTSVSRRNEFLEPSSIPARQPCWRDLDGEWWMDRGDSRVFTNTPG